MSRVEIERFKITLCSNGNVWVWMRNDNQLVSPEFRTLQCAKAWADSKMPFMTDDEWRITDPNLSLSELQS